MSEHKDTVRLNALKNAIDAAISSAESENRRLSDRLERLRARMKSPYADFEYMEASLKIANGAEIERREQAAVCAAMKNLLTLFYTPL